MKGVLLTVEDLARELGIHRATVYRMLDAGTLPPPRRPFGPKGHPRWHRDDIPALRPGTTTTEDRAAEPARPAIH